MDDVKVEQRHREAAAVFYENRFPNDFTFAGMAREGRCDSSLTVQAFARFERDHMAPAPGGEVEQVAGWRQPTATPAVSKGRDAYFIVAVRRQHNGEVFSFPATYANELELLFEDAEDDDGVRLTSGWFSVEAEGEDGNNYRPLLNPGDELLGWCDYPRWSATLAQPAAVPTREELEGVLREAREQLNDTSAICGNLEWRADLQKLVARIDALLAQVNEESEG